MNKEKIILEISNLRKNYHDDDSEITAIENINLEIYKSYQLDTGTEYIRCNVTTDELIKINKEYKKAVKLKEENKLVGKQITGTYMVRDGNNFIAFDDDSKLVYVSANGIQAIFEWNSSIYEIVSGTCSI